jgi:hypothetical protein
MPSWLRVFRQPEASPPSFTLSLPDLKPALSQSRKTYSQTHLNDLAARGLISLVVGLAEQAAHLREERRQNLQHHWHGRVALPGHHLVHQQHVHAHQLQLRE